MGTENVRPQWGRVAAYRPAQGYGFIRPAHDGGRLFVTRDDVEDEQGHLVPGEVVEYRPAVGSAGQLKAVEVRRVPATIPGFRDAPR